MPRVANDTRARILATASELFIEQGFEATSLREIADRLGVTKAALYYHFQSKDEILVALLQPADDMVEELLHRLEAARDLGAWGEAMEWVIEAMFDFADFFRLIMSNRAAVEQVMRDMAVFDDHEQMHQRVMKAVLAASDDLGERVRMVAALGAVTGFDDWAPSLMLGTPADDLRVELRAAVRDTLGLGDSAGGSLRSGADRSLRSGAGR